MDPERAHGFALGMARLGGAMFGRLCAGGRVHAPGLSCEVAGIRFCNPVGLAAGFDKNGVALPFWRGLGFGCVEIGTVTPRPQPGNARPRLWRFPELKALGNRLGFPSEGAAAVAERVGRTRPAGMVVGINLGKNKQTPNERAALDYLEALEATREVADYWAINVSSPNTPGLRDLQAGPALTELLGQVREAAGEVPLFVKLSPDLEEGALEEAAGVCMRIGCAGIIATNTTRARPEGVAFEGGLSGRPLAERSRVVLGLLRRICGPDCALISAGGIDSAAEARARLKAGASLVQIYSALVYEGPGLVHRILRGL